MFDVGDPARSAVLTGLFLTLAAITLLSVLPWGASRTRHRWVFFLPLAGAAVYAAYEAAMPPRFDIRVDLLLVWPMGVVVFASWLFRVVRSRAGPRATR